MRILHTSDLHGCWSELQYMFANKNWDMWIDTGDFFNNSTRGHVESEVPYQESQFNKSFRDPGLVAGLLAGRPVLTVRGNHDYISLAENLKLLGVDATELNMSSHKVGDLVFAGFPHIPYIIGEWANEIQQGDFHQIVEATFAHNPDVLLTHAPPSGILSGEWGIRALTSYLQFRENFLKAHFFGHVHDHGGWETQMAGMRFYNGACRLKVVNL